MEKNTQMRLAIFAIMLLAALSIFDTVSRWQANGMTGAVILGADMIPGYAIDSMANQATRISQSGVPDGQPVGIMQVSFPMQMLIVPVTAILIAIMVYVINEKKIEHERKHSKAK